MITTLIKLEFMKFFLNGNKESIGREFIKSEAFAKFWTDNDNKPLLEQLNDLKINATPELSHLLEECINNFIISESPEKLKKIFNKDNITFKKK